MRMLEKEEDTEEGQVRDADSWGGWRCWGGMRGLGRSGDNEEGWGHCGRRRTFGKDKNAE